MQTQPIFFEPDPSIRAIPDELKRDIPERGQVTEITYRVPSGEKRALVYVPYGYDSSRRYDVLYLMHGGGGTHTTCLGEEDQVLRQALDHLIHSGELRPLLVVTPTFYPIGNTVTTPERSGELVPDFPHELVDCLMPVVESTFSTYAETADPAGFRASRDHRAFGGFSMGAVTTWYVFMQALDCFRWYLPMSGDCWQYGRLGGGTEPEKTAAALAEAARRQHLPEWFIWAITGSNDIAHPNLTPQIHAMADDPDVFRFGASPDDGNIRYSVQEGAWHCYEAVWDFLYSALPRIWGVEHTTDKEHD